MKVRILTHTPEPEKLIAAAAKLCYASAEIDELLDGLTAEKTASFNMLNFVSLFILWCVCYENRCAVFVPNNFSTYRLNNIAYRQKNSFIILNRG